MPSPLVYIITVNWNNAKDTEECLDSVLKIDYPNYHVVVVDNASRDEDFSFLPERFAACNKVTFVRNRSNIGFAAGNNVGIRKALQDGADFIFLLNNDTVVHSGILSHLVKPFSRAPQIAATGAKIYMHGKKDILWYAGGRYVPGESKAQMYGCDMKDSAEYNVPGECTFIPGCAFFFKADLIREIGFLDETFYHSGEDLDFSIRILRAGFKMWYTSQAIVWHKVHGATTAFMSTYFEYYFRLVVLRKHGFLTSMRSKAKVAIVYMRDMIHFSLGKKKAHLAYAVILSVLDYALGRSRFAGRGHTH
jgi:GT2 family glycosyltransferase